MAKRDKLKDYYFIFDGNHNCEEGEILREEGFKVWGGSKFTDDLENDREYGMEFAESCGLHSPEQQEFSSAEEGIAFLEEHEEDAYVFKPNASSDNSKTYVPINQEGEKANKELQSFLEAFSNDECTSSYILQKVVKGVEVNVEAYFINGKAVFAHANFENKKSYSEDMGRATGCAFDVDFEIGLDTELYQITVGLMADKLEELNYTGLADANVIIGDFNEVYFLEFCFRTGYNAAVNFHFNLCNKSFLETCSDMIDGVVDIKAKKGFGATITMFTDDFYTGLPIYIPEDIEKDVFLFDAYEENDMMKMAGTSNEILIVCGHGYTISETLAEVEEKCRKIVFKDRYMRLDTWKHNTNRSPQRRFEALRAMNLC
jgi:phosphoribosylamine--glycine ligase